MKSAKLLLAAFLIIAPLSVFAQNPPLTSTTQTNIPMRTFAPGPTTTLVNTPGTVASAPAVTQNTVSTTGPVQSNTTISVGTLAGQILNWIMVAFGPVIGSMVVWILVRVLKKLGIDATDALRARLQDIVVNGMNSGAAQIEKNMQGKDPIDIKNAVVASAVTYTQAHAAETIKALGLDPQSGAAVEAIKAKIETAINDPNVATPPVLGGLPKAA